MFALSTITSAGATLTLAGSQGRGDDRPVAGFKMLKRQKLEKDGWDSWGWIQFQFTYSTSWVPTYEW